MRRTRTSDTTSRAGKDASGQLVFDWTAFKAPAKNNSEQRTEASPGDLERQERPFVLTLPWDFKHSFPTPTERAIEAGILYPDDCEPENVKSLHAEHARQCLGVLSDLDRVMAARDLLLDPTTGHKPKKEREEALRTRLTSEIARLEHTLETLLDTYADALAKKPKRHFSVLLPRGTTDAR